MCGGNGITELLTIDRAPVLANQLCRTHDEAIDAATARIRLGFCRSCGHVFNLDFDPRLLAYGPEYENSLHFSAHFQRYADGLAAALVERFDLHDRTIVEVGCGNGDFLKAMCQLGPNRGYGFDPSAHEKTVATDGVHIVRRNFAADVTADIPIDLLCCRHCLEHIGQPIEFLRGVRTALTDRSSGQVFFEVPNALYTLLDLGIWDIIYEHPSYFCPSSLTYAFCISGFYVEDVKSTFGDQFLTIYARAGEVTAGPSVDADLVVQVERFSEAYAKKVADWQGCVANAAAAGQRVVVWGAGSKGSSFLNALRGFGTIEHVVDVNPRKAGMFIAGTGQRIVPPPALKEIRPDVVILMNPVYRTEIAAAIHELGLRAELLVA